MHRPTFQNPSNFRNICRWKKAVVDIWLIWEINDMSWSTTRMMIRWYQWHIVINLIFCILFFAAMFTVMCYNVLCDKYATRQLYGYCPSWALNWEYRKKGIMEELTSCDADIISLQVNGLKLTLPLQHSCYFFFSLWLFKEKKQSKDGWIFFSLETFNNLKATLFQVNTYQQKHVSTVNCQRQTIPKQANM